MYWLPVYLGIDCIIATLTYKVVTLDQPLYLTHLVAPYTPGRYLRRPRTNTRSQSLQFPPSLAVEDSVMQHLQYGISFLSKFAIARRLPLFRETSRLVILPVHFLSVDGVSAR